MRGLVLRQPKEVPWHKILDGQIRSQDLRSKLARPNLRLVRQSKGGLSIGVTDLREKLSGSSSQPPPVSRAQGGVELQRQLTTFVRNSSSGAQAASHQVPLPHLKQTAPVVRTPAGVSFLHLQVKILLSINPPRLCACVSLKINSLLGRCAFSPPKKKGARISFCNFYLWPMYWHRIPGWSSIAFIGAWTAHVLIFCEWNIQRRVHTQPPSFGTA
jgi:hypothetical protein